MTTGERIRQARIEKGWTQKQLGELCGIAEPTIRRYELGKLNPKKETLEKIAAPLGVYYLNLYGDNQAEEIINATKETIAKSPGAAQRLPDFDAALRIPWQFSSEENRIRFFYNFLNTDGLLMAIECFLSHLKPEDMKEVADYVEALAKTPQYQRPQDKE